LPLIGVGVACLWPGSAVSIALPPRPNGDSALRTANYVFSVVSIVLGIALILFMLLQGNTFNIGTAIGLVLILNGSVRLWFAQDDH